MAISDDDSTVPPPCRAIGSCRQGSTQSPGRANRGRGRGVGMRGGRGGQSRSNNTVILPNDAKNITTRDTMLSVPVSDNFLSTS